MCTRFHGIWLLASYKVRTTSWSSSKIQNLTLLHKQPEVWQLPNFLKSIHLGCLPHGHSLHSFWTKVLRVDHVQTKLDQLEGDLLELNSNSEKLQRSQAELVELSLVLEKAGSFFSDAQSQASSSTVEARSSLSDGETSKSNSVSDSQVLRGCFHQKLGIGNLCNFVCGLKSCFLFLCDVLGRAFGS